MSLLLPSSISPICLHTCVGVYTCVCASMHLCVCVYVSQRSIWDFLSLLRSGNCELKRRYDNIIHLSEWQKSNNSEWKSGPTAPAAHKDAELQEPRSLIVRTGNEIVILEDRLPVKNDLTSYKCYSFVQSINYTLKHLAHQPESLCPRKNSRMFAEVSFKIKETWNPPRCPPADGWSVLHHRTEYYSVPERNELPNPRRHGWILNAFIYVAYDSNSILETIAYIYLNKWLYKTLRIWWEPEGRTGYVKQRTFWS